MIGCTPVSLHPGPVADEHLPHTSLAATTLFPSSPQGFLHLESKALSFGPREAPEHRTFLPLQQLREAQMPDLPPRETFHEEAESSLLEFLRSQTLASYPNFFYLRFWDCKDNIRHDDETVPLHSAYSAHMEYSRK